MPESHLIMRAWRDEDEVGILELEKAVWGETEAVDPAFFDWQYRRNPEGRAAIFCYEAPDGRIAAQYAVIPIPLRVKGTRIAGSLSLNTVTHPDYRRLGLFTKAATAVYEQLRRSMSSYGDRELYIPWGSPMRTVILGSSRNWTSRTWDVRRSWSKFSILRLLQPARIWLINGRDSLLSYAR